MTIRRFKIDTSANNKHSTAEVKLTSDTDVFFRVSYTKGKYGPALIMFLNCRNEFTDSKKTAVVTKHFIDILENGSNILLDPYWFNLLKAYYEVQELNMTLYYGAADKPIRF